MGGASSTASEPGDADPPHMARDIRLLLGSLDHLDPMAKKLVSLGKQCLTSTILDSQQDNFSRLDKFNAGTGGGVATCEGSQHGTLEGSQDTAREGSRDRTRQGSHDRTGASQSFETGKERTFSNQSSSNSKPVDFDDVTWEGPSGPQSSGNSRNTGASASGLDSPGLFLPLTQTGPLYQSQTFNNWRYVYQLKNMFQMCVPTRKIIFIQPIDEFPEFLKDFRISIKSLSLDMFGFLQGFTQIFFNGMDVAVLPPLSMDNMGWSLLVKSRINTTTGQKQYRAKDFYSLLQKVLPSDGHCILGLMWTDLYPEDDLNFVLGETSFNHRSGIFCFGRFETKGFNKETHRDLTEVDAFLLWKLMKAISHELCHLFGLGHCTFFHCSMNESTSMVEAMDQPLFLCPVCLRKLHEVCRFDVVDRYQRLLDFLSDLQMQYPSVQCDHAIGWLHNCLTFLREPQTPLS